MLKQMEILIHLIVILSRTTLYSVIMKAEWCQMEIRNNDNSNPRCLLSNIILLSSECWRSKLTKKLTT